MGDKKGRSGHGGFSLVEVAVAAAIFSLGLGSMSLLLIMAVSGTYAPRSATLAALYAQSLAEAVRMVPDARFDGAGDPANCIAAAACSPGSMAGSIMESWQVQIERDLPTGRGLVCQDSTPADALCTPAKAGSVTVLWQTSDPESGETAPREFTLDLPLR